MSFYSTKEWRKTRAAIRKRDGYRCTNCGADARKASRVDHIIPLKVRPDLALAPSNLRTLCVPCDNARHREKGRPTAERAEVREDGMPADPNSEFWR
jgi:5-methylcytosine-specific restriction endonuclease McrA